MMSGSQTKWIWVEQWNDYGPVQIRNLGSAFLVSYPDKNNPGYQREKTFDKIFPTAWNNAQAFAAEKRRGE